MNKSFVLYVLLLVLSSPIYSQTKVQDIMSYKFEISLTDFNDSIYVTSTIKGTTDNNTVELNLTNNMVIDGITSNGKNLTFSRSGDIFYISVPSSPFNFNINYRGIPSDGLIIGKNKFGDRTFFGDNWPERARNWLTVYDHPSDKAKVEFIVKAPKKYKVVSNGKKISETTGDLYNIYHYKTKKEIPTKVMVIGVADFTTLNVQKSPFEITSFAYPQDKYTALVDYSIAPQITFYFESIIGRYPFSKLYNVQSTTKYGGMENAGCIFYDENSVDGKKTNENLLAHEIAHQWFGNSVTEEDWRHLWLSEGFATYLENMYIENKYGEDSLNSIMIKERQLVLDYKERYPNKVLVPNKVDDPNTMLNPYSYQKGAWILHMIRKEVGDENFITLLKRFYSRYKYKNATTNDFIDLVVSRYGEVIKLLLEPWLYSSSLPKYDVQWDFKDGKIIGKLIQTQKDEVFINHVELLLEYPNTPVLKRISVTSKNQDFEFDSTVSPLKIIIDPHMNILTGN